MKSHELVTSARICDRGPSLGEDRGSGERGGARRGDARACARESGWLNQRFELRDLSVPNLSALSRGVLADDDADLPAGSRRALRALSDQAAAPLRRPASAVSGATGLEPAASGLTGRRGDNQLRHAPKREPEGAMRALRGRCRSWTTTMRLAIWPSSATCCRPRSRSGQWSTHNRRDEGRAQYVDSALIAATTLEGQCVHGAGTLRPAQRSGTRPPSHVNPYCRFWHCHPTSVASVVSVQYGHNNPLALTAH